jgi:ribosomal protein S19E (S16A)
VIEDLIKRREKVDKVMFSPILRCGTATEGNSFEDSWNYIKIAPNAKLYIFDLAGYGRQPLISEK